MKPCVVNVAIGGQYPAGQERLRASLREQGYLGHRLLLDRLPKHSPPHHMVPYAFKTFAIREAIRHEGCDTILWADASMVAVRPIMPILEHAAAFGVAVWFDGWAVGQWCHDEGLEKLELTRDEAMTIPLLAGGLVGISTLHPLGAEFLERWHGYATDGVSFRGPWTNDGNLCSDDPRCKGHRHDMPSLSVLAHRMKIKPLSCPRWYQYLSGNAPIHDSAIIVAKGI